jgi:hypothetical protein
MAAGREQCADRQEFARAEPRSTLIDRASTLLCFGKIERLHSARDLLRMDHAEHSAC